MPNYTLCSCTLAVIPKQKFMLTIFGLSSPLLTMQALQ